MPWPLGGAKKSNADKDVSFWSREMDKCIQEKNMWAEKAQRMARDMEVLRGELFLSRKECMSLRAQMEVCNKQAEAARSLRNHHLHSQQPQAPGPVSATPRQSCSTLADLPSAPATPADVARLKDKISELSRQLSCMTSEAMASGRHQAMLEDRVKELVEQLATAHLQAQYLRETAEAHQKEAATLRDELFALRNINRDTADETTKVLEELSAAQRRCAELAGELSLKEQMVSLLRLQLGELNALNTPAEHRSPAAVSAAGGPLFGIGGSASHRFPAAGGAVGGVSGGGALVSSYTAYHHGSFGAGGLIYGDDFKVTARNQDTPIRASTLPRSSAELHQEQREQRGHSAPAAVAASAVPSAPSAAGAAAAQPSEAAGAGAGGAARKLSASPHGGTDSIYKSHNLCREAFAQHGEEEAACDEVSNNAGNGNKECDGGNDSNPPPQRQQQDVHDMQDVQQHHVKEQQQQDETQLQQRQDGQQQQQQDEQQQQQQDEQQQQQQQLQQAADPSDTTATTAITTQIAIPALSQAPATDILPERTTDSPAATNAAAAIATITNTTAAVDMASTLASFDPGHYDDVDPQSNDGDHEYDDLNGHDDDGGDCNGNDNGSSSPDDELPAVGISRGNDNGMAVRGIAGKGRGIAGKGRALLAAGNASGSGRGGADEADAISGIGVIGSFCGMLRVTSSGLLMSPEVAAAAAAWEDSLPPPPPRPCFGPDALDGDDDDPIDGLDGGPGDGLGSRALDEDEESAVTGGGGGMTAASDVPAAAAVATERLIPADTFSEGAAREDTSGEGATPEGAAVRKSSDGSPSSTDAAAGTTAADAAAGTTAADTTTSAATDAAASTAADAAASSAAVNAAASTSAADAVVDAAASAAAAVAAASTAADTTTSTVADVAASTAAAAAHASIAVDAAASTTAAVATASSAAVGASTLVGLPAPPVVVQEGAAPAQERHASIGKKLTPAAAAATATNTTASTSATPMVVPSPAMLRPVSRRLASNAAAATPASTDAATTTTTTGTATPDEAPSSSLPLSLAVPLKPTGGEENVDKHGDEHEDEEKEEEESFAFDRLRAVAAAKAQSATTPLLPPPTVNRAASIERPRPTIGRRTADVSQLTSTSTPTPVPTVTPSSMWHAVPTDHHGLTSAEAEERLKEYYGGRSHGTKVVTDASACADAGATMTTTSQVGPPQGLSSSECASGDGSPAVASTMTPEAGSTQAVSPGSEEAQAMTISKNAPATSNGGDGVGTAASHSGSEDPGSRLLGKEGAAQEDCGQSTPPLGDATNAGPSGVTTAESTSQQECMGSANGDTRNQQHPQPTRRRNDGAQASSSTVSSLLQRFDSATGSTAAAGNATAGTTSHGAKSKGGHAKASRVAAMRSAFEQRQG